MSPLATVPEQKQPSLPSPSSYSSTRLLLGETQMALSEIGLFYLRAAAKSEGGLVWLSKPKGALKQIDPDVPNAISVLQELQRAKLLAAQPAGDQIDTLKWAITPHGRTFLKDWKASPPPPQRTALASASPARSTG
jgi:hypothetical protein